MQIAIYQFIIKSSFFIFVFQCLCLSFLIFFNKGGFQSIQCFGKIVWLAFEKFALTVIDTVKTKSKARSKTSEIAIIDGFFPALSTIPPNNIRAERISVIPIIPRYWNLGMTDKEDSNVGEVLKQNGSGYWILRFNNSNSALIIARAFCKNSLLSAFFPLPVKRCCFK